MAEGAILQLAPLAVDAGYAPPVDAMCLWEEPNPETWLAMHGAGVRVLVLHSGFPLPFGLLESLPNLGLIANFGVGLDHLDPGDLAARGIRLTHTPGMLTADVADLAILLMLACLRRLPEGHAAVVSGAWPARPWPLGRSARGRHLGIFGMGRIGREVARIGAALEMPVGQLARATPPDPGRLAFADLGALADWSDVLVIAAPGGAATERAVNRGILDRLGPQGVLVNVARASIVDEAALAAALCEGTLGAAGIDCFMPGPAVDARLRSAPHLVASPYAGSATIETRRAMADSVWRNAMADLTGDPLEFEYRPGAR